MALQQALIPVRLAMQELLRAGVENPYSKIASLSRELLLQWEALWTFSRVEGVEPTGYPLGECSRARVAWGSAVAQGKFWLAKRRGLSVCGAGVECAGDVRAAGARAVRVHHSGSSGGVGRRRSTDTHSSAREGGLQRADDRCVATERANDVQMGSLTPLNRIP